MRLHPCLVIPCALWQSAAASERPTARFGIAPGPAGVWIWERSSEHADSVVRFAYCESSSEGTWRCRRGPAVQGSVVAGCATGRDVLVFFEDGGLRALAAPHIALGDAQTTTSTIQRGLPHGGGVFHVAGDSKSERIFVLTTAAVSRRLDAQRAAASARAAESDEPLRFGMRRNGSRPSVADGATPRATTGHGPGGSASLDAAELDSTSLVAVRFERGAWSVDRPAPDGVREHEDVLAFWVGAGGLRILSGPRGGSLPRTFWRTEATAEPWVADVAPPNMGEGVSWAGGFDEAAGEDVLAVVDGTAGSQNVRVWRYGEGRAWRSVDTLRLRSGEVAMFSTPPVIAVAGSRIYTSASEGAEPASVMVWSSSNGTEVGGIPALAALHSVPLPTLNPIARHAIQYAVLALVLSSVVIWRRDRLTESIVLQPGQRPASLSRRGLAFVIDLAVIAPVAGPTVSRLWDLSTGGATSWEELLRGAELASSPLFWTGSLLGAEFGCYAAVFEAFLGATVGKRLCGCRVVGDGGSECRFREILLRNVVRIVEFHFTASFLVILLTPGRQRIGDLLGRTVVVERGAIAPPSPDADEPPTESDDA